MVGALIPGHAVTTDQDFSSRESRHVDGESSHPRSNLTRVLDADSWSGRRHLLEKVSQYGYLISNLGSAPKRAVSTVLSEGPILSSARVAGSVPLAGLVLEWHRCVRDNPCSVVLWIVDLRRAVGEDAFTVFVGVSIVPHSVRCDSRWQEISVSRDEPTSCDRSQPRRLFP